MDKKLNISSRSQWQESFNSSFHSKSQVVEWTTWSTTTVEQAQTKRELFLLLIHLLPFDLQNQVKVIHKVIHIHYL